MTTPWPTRSPDGEATMMEMDADHGHGRAGCRSGSRRSAHANCRTRPGGSRSIVNYQFYTAEFDELVRAEELCDAGRDDRACAALLGPAARIPLQHATSKLANRLQRKLMAIQNRTWEFDLEEGLLDYLAPRAGDRRPDEPARLQAREGDAVPRHGRHDADRLVGLDAWPLHHHCRHVRGHPRPHARTLLGARRDSRVHHARLAWAVNRGNAGSRLASRRTRGA